MVHIIGKQNRSWDSASLSKINNDTTERHRSRQSPDSKDLNNNNNFKNTIHKINETSYLLWKVQDKKAKNAYNESNTQIHDNMMVVVYVNQSHNAFSQCITIHLTFNIQTNKQTNKKSPKHSLTSKQRLFGFLLKFSTFKIK